MTYVSSNRSDRELYTYVTKEVDLKRDEDGCATAAGTEYPVEVEHYNEYEGGYLFWSESTYYFTDSEGTEHTFGSEDEVAEWMEANGYSADY